MTGTDTLTTLSLGASVGLIALLRAGPDRVREELLHLLRVRSQPNLEILIKRLVWIASLSALIKTNRYFNYLARNNWVRPKKGEWDWPKEIAVVTGGSGGVGSYIVKGLAEKGVKVAVVDVVEPKPGQFSAYPNVHYFECDITKKENVDKTAAEIKEKLGAPSILCNNAGIAHAHTMLEATPDYLRKLFDINVISHFYTLQAFLPDMIAAKKGHVVTTASIASFVTPAGLVDYCASKAAALSIHEGLNTELKYRYKAPGIRTTSVHPAYIQTPLIESWEKSLDKNKTKRLTPEWVGAEIVKAILSGTSQQLVLPRTMGFTSAFKAFPAWLQEFGRGGARGDMRRL